MSDEIEVYVPPEEHVAPIDDETLIDLAANVDARAKAQLKIIHAVASIAGKKGIDKIGGNPYFNSGGCSRIANVLGISWEKPTERKENLPEGHYQYIFDSTFTFKGRSCAATGSASSSKPFYSKKGEEDVPPSEIDEGNVRKHAFTNMMNNGIKNIFGLRNLSWDDLQAVGVDPGAGAQVEYDSKKKAESDECRDKRAEIHMWIKEMKGGVQTDCELYLHELTTWTTEDGKVVAGKKKVAALTEKQVHKIYPTVKADHEAWKKEHPDEPVTD